MNNNQEINFKFFFNQYFIDHKIKNGERKLSYFRNNDIKQWATEKCRIDPSFWIEIVLQIVRRNNWTSINETLLTRTRNIRKNTRNYRASNQQDIQAFRTWFNIKSKNKISSLVYDKSNKFSDEEIEFYIEEYLSDFIKVNKIYNKLTNSFLEYIEEKNKLEHYTLYRSIELYTEEISRITDCNIRKENWKILTFDDLRNNFKRTELPENDNLIFNTRTINDDISEINGERAEQIAEKILIKMYGANNVIWKSKINKYLNHDFEIVNIYPYSIFVEVKSSSKKNMDRFFMSRQEFRFYNTNKNKYKMLFIWNLFESRVGNCISVYYLENFDLKVSYEFIGYDKETNILYVTPNQFIGSFQVSSTAKK